MASGVPVVGARAGGIPDTIDEGVTGLLVRPHDPSALAAALASVLHDADRRARMGRAAREDALRRSWAAATDILVDAYDSAILRHAS
jgi:glycosyltransferase involved in cell wall biosynthesis